MGTRAGVRHSLARRRVAALALVALALGGPATVDSISIDIIDATPPAALDDSATADPGTDALRLDRTQLEPADTPPTYGGCLLPGVRSTHLGTAPRTWQQQAIPLSRWPWRIALHPTAGPRGALVMVGDSITAQAVERTMDTLIALGYGPICIDALTGRYAVDSSAARITTGVGAAERIIASDPVWHLANTSWVIALGTNDTANTSSARIAAVAAAHIAAVRATIGPLAVPQYWIDVATLRGTVPRETVWNEVLRASGVDVVPWSTFVSRTPDVHIRASDLVHLTDDGNSLRIALLAYVLRPI